jgi:hypothetical protein
MSMTRYHPKDGIIDEGNIYEELSLPVQVKLTELSRQSSAAQ